MKIPTSGTALLANLPKTDAPQESPAAKRLTLVKADNPVETASEPLPDLPVKRTLTVFDEVVTNAQALRSSQDLLTLPELADALKVPRGTIYYWVSRNEIPHMRVGRHLRFVLTTVVAFFERRTKEDSPTCIQPVPRVCGPGQGSLKTKNASRASNRKEVKYGN